MIEVAGGVVIDDISRILITHPKKKYASRTKPVTTLFVHHSGADNGRDGLQAWAATAGYHVITKQWPGIAYHFGITLRPSYDIHGRLVIHRLNADDVECYHTRGCNRFSVGLCLQGHHGKEPLSDFQIECLEAFLPWWSDTYQRDLRKDLGWHSRAIQWGGVPKLACPGKYAVEWIKSYKALI